MSFKYRSNLFNMSGLSGVKRFSSGTEKIKEKNQSASYLFSARNQEDDGN